MFPAFLLTLRETLEAVLIIGIVLSTLQATHRNHQKRFVWLGTISGIILSLAVAVLLNVLGARLEGVAEEVFEGVMMLLAAAVLTWMIFWMQTQSSQLSQILSDEVRATDQGASGLPLLSLAFLAVFREGLELSLFLTAASFTSSQAGIIGGFLSGVVLALALGWALTTGLLRLDIRRFFQVTSILLILVAGGLIAHGIHEFNEVGWIPAIIEHVWDLNPWFNEKSIFGQMMTALFGYNANPSLSEVLASITYYSGLVIFLYRRGRTSNINTAISASDDKI